MIPKTFHKIIHYIKTVADPEAVILFGSFAKGKNTMHSDIDLVLIMDHVYLKQRLEHQISLYIGELSLKSDVLIRSKQEIEIAKSDPLSFLGSILKEGKIIYQKQS